MMTLLVLFSFGRFTVQSTLLEKSHNFEFELKSNPGLQSLTYGSLQLH